MNEFGIYILTYPGDYYLSTALINSLKHFAPDTPIMIIPGEGVKRDDHPFNVPLMPKPDGFWGKIGHADRKFWSFQGPFEKFLYLDADIICTRSIKPLIKLLTQQSGNFINVKINIDDDNWRLAIADTKHKWHDQCLRRVSSQIGNIDLLKKFDPDYNPYARYPFNDGLFASRRFEIDVNIFEDLYKREREFFKRQLNKEFCWKSFDLFFGDQGRLNYLVDRLDIPRYRLNPYGNYIWGGVPKSILVDKVLLGEADHDFIHWAGCPRPNPSIFCKRPFLPLLAFAYPGLPSEYKLQKEIPGYSVWWHFAADEQQKWSGFSQRLKWTWRDLKKILNRGIRTLGGLLKHRLSRHKVILRT